MSTAMIPYVTNGIVPSILNASVLNLICQWSKTSFFQPPVNYLEILFPYIVSARLQRGSVAGTPVLEVHKLISKFPIRTSQTFKTTSLMCSSVHLTGSSAHSSERIPKTGKNTTVMPSELEAF